MVSLEHLVAGKPVYVPTDVHKEDIWLPMRLRYYDFSVRVADCGDDRPAAIYPLQLCEHTLWTAQDTAWNVEKEVFEDPELCRAECERRNGGGK